MVVGTASVHVALQVSESIAKHYTGVGRVYAKLSGGVENTLGKHVISCLFGLFWDFWYYFWIRGLIFKLFDLILGLLVLFLGF